MAICSRALDPEGSSPVTKQQSMSGTTGSPPSAFSSFLLLHSTCPSGAVLLGPCWAALPWEALAGSCSALEAGFQLPGGFISVVKG